MRVTVCELPGPSGLEAAWVGLAAHVREAGSELLLLPELPFAPWLPATREVDPAAWAAAADAHARWLERVAELGVAAVGTRPVVTPEGRYNEGFLLEPTGAVRAWRRKTYLPDEEAYWEASWYERGPTTFDALAIGAAQAGLTVCTELWFLERARAYAREGCSLLLCPRATPLETRDKWLAGGRVAATVSGAWHLSSARAGVERGHAFSGAGWIAEPEEGALVAVTSAEQPWITRELDLAAAAAAQRTYPRDVDDSPRSA